MIEAFLLNQQQQVVIDGHAPQLAVVTSRINLRASSVPAIYVDGIGSDLTSQIRPFGDDCSLLCSY